jgi:hypothetical protein
MKKKYFTEEEKKLARKKWNKDYYEKRKKLMEFAKRTMELQKQMIKPKQ